MAQSAVFAMGAAPCLTPAFHSFPAQHSSSSRHCVSFNRATHARASENTSTRIASLQLSPWQSGFKDSCSVPPQLAGVELPHRCRSVHASAGSSRARKTSKRSAPLGRNVDFQTEQCCGSFTGSPVYSFASFHTSNTRRKLRPVAIRAQAEGDEEGITFQDFLGGQSGSQQLSPTVNSSPPEFKPLHEIGDVVAGKYRITGVLGTGGLGTMFEAELLGSESESVMDAGQGRTWEEAVAASKAGAQRKTKIALKAMSLRGMKAWKDLELFEREARVLQSLKHPGIAEYIDSFEVDTDRDRTFYIAQKVAPGKSIADLVKSGWRVGEEEVKRIALEVLGVLEYLEKLRPSVVHRDIKPENIIIDTDGAGGGSGTVKVRGVSVLFWQA
jgi:hypothetical protein